MGKGLESKAKAQTFSGDVQSFESEWSHVTGGVEAQTGGDMPQGGGVDFGG
jgi:hypothetical protein